MTNPNSNPAILESLPLFPLGTVLYPGGILPLRIFEVRYLDLIGKCHKAGAPFGVVGLTHGEEVRKAGQAAEIFHDVGTLAHITDLVSPQAGLLVVRCVGTQRFKIQNRELLRHGLWVAQVERIDDDTSVAIPPDLQNAADALQRLITSLAERQARQTSEAGYTEPPDPKDLPFQSPHQLQDCAWVANRWCELLPMPQQTKQRLMALENPLMRLELVNDFLQRAGITP